MTFAISLSTMWKTFLNSNLISLCMNRRNLILSTAPHSSKRTMSIILIGGIRFLLAINLRNAFLLPVSQRMYATAPYAFIDALENTTRLGCPTGCGGVKGLGNFKRSRWLIWQNKFIHSFFSASGISSSRPKYSSRGHNFRINTFAFIMTGDNNPAGSEI